MWSGRSPIKTVFLCISFITDIILWASTFESLVNPFVFVGSSPGGAIFAAVLGLDPIGGNGDSLGNCCCWASTIISNARSFPKRVWLDKRDCQGINTTFASMRHFDKANVVDDELHDLKLRFELLGMQTWRVSHLVSRGRQKGLLWDFSMGYSTKQDWNQCMQTKEQGFERTISKIQKGWSLILSLDWKLKQGPCLSNWIGKVRPKDMRNP